MPILAPIRRLFGILANWVRGANERVWFTTPKGLRVDQSLSELSSRNTPAVGPAVA